MSQAGKKPLSHSAHFYNGDDGKGKKDCPDLPERNRKGCRPGSVLSEALQLSRLLPCFSVEESRGNKMYKCREMREYSIITKLQWNFEFQKSSESHSKWSARIDMHLVRHRGRSVQFETFGKEICFSQRWILWPITTEDPRPTEEPESALKCETISWECWAIWLSCEKVHKNIVIDIVEREHTLSRLLKLSIFMEISSQEKYTKRRWSICMYRDLASDKHPYDNVGSTQHINEIWQELWIVLATSPGNEVWLMQCHLRKGQICISLTFVLVGSQKWMSFDPKWVLYKSPRLLQEWETMWGK